MLYLNIKNECWKMKKQGFPEKTSLFFSLQKLFDSDQKEDINFQFTSLIKCYHN